MRTACCNILPHAIQFLSLDVFNVIFAKTSITPSFFYAKDKDKTKIYPERLPGLTQYQSVQKLTKKRLQHVLLWLQKF